MKKWKMRFTPEASRLVAKLHPENKKQLKQALNGLRQNPYTGKDLQEELFGFKSLRLKKIQGYLHCKRRCKMYRDLLHRPQERCL